MSAKATGKGIITCSCGAGQGRRQGHHLWITRCKKTWSLKLGQPWLRQAFYLCVCVCRLFVCLNVNICVLRLILKFNMFFMKVKCIRKKFLKSRKFFVSWVLMPLKIANMAIWLFLRPKKYVNCPEWWYMYSKIFYSWNSLTLQLEWHICNFIHFDDPYCTPHKIILKNKHLFKMSTASKSNN